MLAIMPKDGRALARLDEALATTGLGAYWLEAPELLRRIREPDTCPEGSHLPRAWVGGIDVTADGNPVIGWVHHGDIYSVFGFRGHGMCIGMGLAPSGGRS